MVIPKVYKVYRRRIAEHDIAFKEFVEVLCRNEIVLEVYLVGSRARGDYLPYSDYDIVVVIPDNKDKLTVIEQLRRLRKKSFPLDLIALHSSELNDPIYSEMLKYAKKLCSKRKTNGRLKGEDYSSPT